MWYGLMLERLLQAFHTSIPLLQQMPGYHDVAIKASPSPPKKGLR
jgi:hypothetical protein